MEKNTTDEIDLGIVFTKIKQGFESLFIGLFRGFQFLLKHWWKVAILMTIGFVYGYFVDKEKKPNKETTIIVQNNFESSSYVYNAIEQLNNKITERDSVFLKQNGFYNEEEVLNEVSIIPIVNIIALLNKSRDNYKSLDLFIQQANFESEILTSEVFYTEYKYHKIYLNTSSEGSSKTIKSLLNYLNDNEILNKIKISKIEEGNFTVKSYATTISHIDDILGSYSNNENKKKLNGNQIYVSTGGNFTDLAELVTAKQTVLFKKDKLLTDLVKYKNIVTIINKPILQEIRSLGGSKKIRYPILLLLSFIFFFLIKNGYFYLKDLSETKRAN